jgi:IS605 OrfB family transposase
MWDGLVADVQQSIQTYLETPEANFPAPSGTSSQPVDSLLEDLLQPISREEEERLKAEIKRGNEDYFRPIRFERFSDNPIIRSSDGEKLWVAPHFQKREDGKTGALPPDGRSIRDVWTYSTRSYHWNRQSNKETLPIQCSQWHMHRFFRNGTPKSSKVHVLDQDIYIHYSFEFETPSDGYEIGNPVMGIDRGEALTAAFSVVSSNGSVLDEGTSAGEALRSRLKDLDNEIASLQEKGLDPSPLWTKRRNLVKDALHRISNQIVRTASKYDAAIAFEDLENLSGLNDPRMTRRQFRRLAEYVRYKAEEEGLWADVEVPPQATSITCPECGSVDQDNRGGRFHPSLDRDQFQCQQCGFEAHSDLNAARLIAIRALWQINGGKSETGCQTLTEYVKSLSRNRESQLAPLEPS